ncbi:PEGA domain-containing protein [Methanogenium marinum]|uniref:PEGA domain-containing protein n=1 Tax=Methanogenium marinum TaxID=348610 RepID=A0A9Q4KNU7_9EURY|nr:PEGA domain-containing protein [Methanogenium marinum]MDE4907460.1 PEGA domain-containing protein [Methanogenium marinum]
MPVSAVPGDESAPLPPIPIVHPVVWNVSHIDGGGGNYSNVSAIPEIGTGDTIQIWGTEGHTYEGGFTIDTANVTIQQWDGSPSRPLLTNTSHTDSAITINADNVTLQGLNISENTYAGNGAGVYAWSADSNAHLQGLNITNCVFSGNVVSTSDSDDSGGAVSIKYVDDLEVKDTTFVNNSAGEHGGAMFVSYSASPDLTDVVFTNNSALYRGGGVYIRDSVTSVLTRTTFLNNCATNSSTYAKGGAVSYYNADNAVVTDATFTNNSANYGGGCYFAKSVNPSITDTSYTDNTASVWGGGCYFEESGNGAIIGSSYTENTAQYGGGCYFSSSPSAAISKTTYTDNTADQRGGGCYLSGSTNAEVTDSSYTENTAQYGGGCYFSSSPSAAISKTTYTDNTADQNGGGCYWYNSAYARITDSTYTGNAATKVGGGTYFYSSGDAEISNVTYTDNTADAYAGGCYLTSSDDVAFLDISANTSAGDDFFVSGECSGVSFTNLTFRDVVNTSVSFTFGGGMKISGATGTQTADPAGYRNISHFVNVTAPDWMLLNVNYIDADVAGLNESSFTMWNTTDDTWGEVSGTNGVNTVEKYVYARLEELSDWHTIAPFADVMGEIRINSTPYGGWIWIDGVNCSVQTNATVVDILPDIDHNVTVMLDDYYTATNEYVNVSQCGTTDVFFDLVHEMGGLQINSTPDGASISLNGTVRGFTNTTLNDLDTGTYNVTVVLDDYETVVNETVIVTNNVTTPVSFGLVHQTGGLQINSTPEGAEIYLNGTSSGFTNTTLNNLDTGTYNVTVVLDDYETVVNETVIVTNNVTTPVSFGLVHQTGGLQINSTPEGAELYLNGTSSGFTNTTLNNLDTGTYNVTVVLDDYVTAINETVIVTNNATTPVSFGLVHQTGDLQINSTPEGAEIFLNGTSSGSTNTTLNDLATGTYNVTVVLDDYETAMNETVIVTNNATTPVSFGLVHQTGDLQINSTPGGAEIFLNSTSSGFTNTTLNDLDTGTYNVTVVLDDYETVVNETVIVTNNVTTPVSFGLVHQTGDLQINSTPEGAEIFLNSTSSGSTNTTLNNLDTGTYNVTVVLDDYETAMNETVIVTNNAPTPVSFDLVHQTGDLQINSTPEVADIYLDGILNASVTNTMLNGLDTGTYNVTVVLDDYETGINDTITVTDDATTPVFFDLVHQTGGLQINSTPSGAQIYLDGILNGSVTNMTLSGLDTGTYNVTVVLEDYETAINDMVTVTDDATNPVFFDLVHQMGGLQINSTPSGAMVYLNGTDTSKLTNVTLTGKPVGTYNVTVALAGYDTSSRTVTLSKDETKYVSFTLVQQLGTLNVNSVPAGASVYLNGTDTDELTNVTLTGKPVGTYNVTVALAGYDTSSRTVTLSKDETKYVSFTLVQQLGTLNVNSVPAGASVYLNGTDTDELTNVTFDGKPVGTYNVTVALAGYDTSSRTVTLSKDETEDVSFTLAQQLGTLNVNSVPAGASVYLNGTDTSKLTNITLTGKPVGTYNVTVALAGYDTSSRTVTLSKDETKDVSFTLAQQLGTLNVNSVPAGASVYLNGTDTSKLTNVTFDGKPVGTYNVTVALDGYDSASRTVTLSKDETEDVSFLLEHQVGTLNVNSVPEGASVYLNGTDTDEITNVTFDGKPVGTYNVTVALAGYDSASRTVTLSKDETEDVSFLLEHQVGTLQVNSIPSGASVYLNGTDTVFLTNVTLDDKPIGTYNVTVALAGYDSASRTVTLSKDETEDVSFTLAQQLGTLNVNSVPEGASVYLNGTATGSLTNVILDGKPVGTYNVTVALAGYDSASRTVTLSKDETEDVSFLLEHQVGTLQVNSIPSGASVYLNGTDTVFLTNVTLDDKPIGTYNVTVALAGYDSASRTVTLSKDETEDVSFTLAQQLGTLNVNSVPEGASVYLNGTATGSLTNVILDDKPIGTYNVTVALAGYDSASRTVTLAKDETEDVSFLLLQQVGTLRVSSTPANATILLDGEDTSEVTNTTLTDVSTGQYTITVEKSGYIIPTVRSVNVEKDDVTDVFFELTHDTGNIFVTSTPDEAWIWLDGCNTTVLTNTTLPDIPVGTHDIRLVKPLYYNTTIQSAIVSENQTENVFFTLTPTGSKPVPSFTATPVSGDAPLPVTFTDTSTGDPGLWNWSFGDGNHSANQNPVHIYTREGAYDVSLTVANSYGDATVTITDCVVVSGTPAVELIAPTGRIPANETAEFSVTADNLDTITELSFATTYDPALVTVEDIAPASLVQEADFEITIDNIQGLVTVELSDGEGITSDTAAPVADITFRATETIAGLRETAALTITDAKSQKSGQDFPVVREDGAINVEARTTIGAPNGTLPVESSKYLTVSASALNDVKNLSFIMEFNRTVMSVTDVRANGTISGLLVDSVIKNENGWLKVSATSPDTITGIESIPLIDISVHSNGLPGEYEIRLINPCWTRDNATYRFDDLKPGYISITPVHASLMDDQPVTVANMTFDDDTQEVSINLAENQNAISHRLTTQPFSYVTPALISPSGQTDWRMSPLNGPDECTGGRDWKHIRSLLTSVVMWAMFTTGISADISGSLSALTRPGHRAQCHHHPWCGE